MPVPHRAPSRTRNPVHDLRGATRLVIDATRGVTDLVEAMHAEISGGPRILGRPIDTPARIATRPVYGSIRYITGLVGTGLDVALAELAPALGERSPGPKREALLSALNGVVGDYLAETGNPLVIEMCLRHKSRPLPLERRALRLALPQAGARVLVLVHGSCLSDQSWASSGRDHAAALARDLGFAPVHLLYNTGLHISTNGRTFAELLERLVAAWPRPVEELVIVGHSMGGLVSRSACHRGEAAGHVWRRKLRALVCLGSPHQGAPLERWGHWVDQLLGVSPYSAPLARLGRVRSAGVTDLRIGYVLDEHWEGRDRFAHARDDRARLDLPEGVECYAIAGTKAPRGAANRFGDGLVPVDSALGRHLSPTLALGFPEAHQWVAHGMNHFDLLRRPEVYAKIRSWLSSRPRHPRRSRRR